jgi:hypothetical protein
MRSWTPTWPTGRPTTWPEPDKLSLGEPAVARDRRSVWGHGVAKS